MNIKELAEKQWEEMSYNGEDPEVTVDFKGQAISNPWMDPTGRFNLSTLGAIDTYGIDKFAEFCGKAAEKLCKNADRTTVLNMCYQIPEYDVLPTEQKNRIYDAVIKGARK